MIIKNILVPVDFSTSADEAVKTAIKLAETLNAKIHLLHVEEDAYRIRQGHAFTVMDRELLPAIDAFHANMLRECTKKLNNFFHKIPEALRGREDVREGHPTDTILKYIVEQNIDLAVLGSHGQSNLTDALLGSTTDRLARKAPCSVLIVKDKNLKRSK